MTPPPELSRLMIETDNSFDIYLILLMSSKIRRGELFTRTSRRLTFYFRIIMSGHSPEEIKKSVKLYLRVFYALIVGTIITVLASYIEFDSFTLTVGLALLIAAVKASLVACYFMHLIDERKMIYSVLSFTTFFFLGLMILTIWASHDKPLNSVYP